MWRYIELCKNSPNFPQFTPLQNDPLYYSCLKGCQILTETGIDMWISPLFQAWKVLQFAHEVFEN